MDTLQKRKKLNILAIVAISVIVLLCTIIISIAFLSNQKNTAGVIKLGELDFSIGEDNLDFPSVMPTNSIDKVVYVGNYRNNNKTDYKNLCDIFFRVDLQVWVDDTYDSELSELVKIENSDTFVKDQHYMYFCGRLKKSEQVNICEKLSFAPEIGNKYQNKQIKLMFFVDAVQADNQAYKEVWQNYPSEWESVVFE